MIKRIERKVKRVRAKIRGTADKPRLSIFRSNRAIYGQAIDDIKRVTLASAKSTDSVAVGAELADKLKKAKISTVYFDRGRYLYHGRVKAVAESMRENGITI